MSKSFWFYSRSNGLLLIFIFILLELTACQIGSLSTLPNPLEKAEDTVHPAEIDSADSESLEGTSGPQPTPSPQETPGLIPTAGEKEVEMITITIVFDNYPYKEGLNTAWGFSAFVTYKDQNVLFDTGAEGLMLLDNMEKMNITPAEVQNVVLSHEHKDHTGGLQSLLSAGADPKIYLPPSFSSSFKAQFNQQAEVIEVVPGLPIAERISTSGEIQGSPPEQALVIDTTRGLVVITGCAHPGVEKMVLAAKQQFHEEVYLVLGGFHLGKASHHEVDQVITELKRLGVVQVGPCHCTGDQSIRYFKEAFGDNFIPLGVGAVIEIER